MVVVNTQKRKKKKEKRKKEKTRLKQVKMHNEKGDHAQGKTR